MYLPNIPEVQKYSSYVLSNDLANNLIKLYRNLFAVVSIAEFNNPKITLSGLQQLLSKFTYLHNIPFIYIVVKQFKVVPVSRDEMFYEIREK